MSHDQKENYSVKADPEMTEMIGFGDRSLLRMLNDFQENMNIKVDKWNL